VNAICMRKLVGLHKCDQQIACGHLIGEPCRPTFQADTIGIAAECQAIGVRNDLLRLELLCLCPRHQFAMAAYGDFLLEFLR
jgi:hypothetical protein